MSPIIEIPPKDRKNAYAEIDLRGEEDVGAKVSIPLFGPDHCAGMDCWCIPYKDDEGVIVHGVCH